MICLNLSHYTHGKQLVTVTVTGLRGTHHTEFFGSLQESGDSINPTQPNLMCTTFYLQANGVDN